MSGQVPGPRIEVTPADQSEIEKDIAELMVAPNYGSPTDAQRWGLTSQPPGQSDSQVTSSLAELELQADLARQRALEGFQQGQLPGLPSTDPTEVAKWQKLYGDSENEKGELRRQLEQALAAQQQRDEMLNQLLASQQQQAPSFQAPNPYQPQPFMPQPQQPTFRDPFEGKTDEDLFSVRDAKRLIGEAIAPALQMQQMQMLQMVDQQAAASKRAAAKLTPLEEFQITRNNGWIRGLPTEAARVDAILSLRESQARVQAPIQAQVQAQAQAPQATAPILRRLTSVEQNVAQAPDLSADAVNAAFQRDYQLANRLPDDNGQRAAALRKVAEKYNIPLGKPNDVAIMRTQILS